jgi:hypothetical protein
MAKRLPLRERIEFKVKWSFVPLVHTYMEVYNASSSEHGAAFLLTHQAAMNSFWNDRMESLVDSNSLLPYVMETIIKDGDKRWKEKVLFRRLERKATFIHPDRKSGKEIIDQFPITANSMDPLSAFFNLRYRISPTSPLQSFGGLTGTKKFKIEGKLVGEEKIRVPAGSFDTYRIECTLSYWPIKGKTQKQLKKTSKDEIRAFSLWITKDSHHYPVQIRYRLSVGSLWVRAVSIRDYGLFS